MARLVVDNTKGDDAQFAAALEVALRRAGFEVEIREPPRQSAYDTAVHFIVSGVSVRAVGELAQHDLMAIAAAVRQVEARRRSVRRRFRSVPVYAGESSRVVEWIDVLDP